jgi:hypothetical protein
MEGQRLNESQWNRIWGEEPSRSVEHIRPQSKGSLEPSTSWDLRSSSRKSRSSSAWRQFATEGQETGQKRKTYESCGLLAATEIAKILKRNEGKWTRATLERRERGLIRWASKEWAD